MHLFKRKAGPRPLPEGEGGVVHVKVQTGMLFQFFWVEIWANPFLGGGGGLGNWHYFFEVT